jgi:hypothetical protein
MARHVNLNSLGDSRAFGSDSASARKGPGLVGARHGDVLRFSWWG